MTLTGMKKFIEALKSAGVNNWEGVTDINTHLYNNENCVNVLDESDDTLYNFAGASGNASPYAPGSIVVKGVNLADLHEVRFGGTINQVKKFIDSFGLTLDEDQMKILIKIYGANYNLKPQTGDYFVFNELTEDEIAKLTEEEKTEYEKNKKEFEKRNSFRSPVQVTV